MFWAILTGQLAEWESTGSFRHERRKGLLFSWIVFNEEHPDYILFLELVQVNCEIISKILDKLNLQL